MTLLRHRAIGVVVLALLAGSPLLVAVCLVVCEPATVVAQAVPAAHHGAHQGAGGPTAAVADVDHTTPRCHDATPLENNDTAMSAPQCGNHTAAQLAARTSLVAARADGSLAHAVPLAGAVLRPNLRVPTFVRVRAHHPPAATPAPARSVVVLRV